MTITKIAFLSLAVCCLRPVSAQTTSGAFHGTVVDSQGSLVTDVAIDIKLQETGAIRKTVTNNAGLYVVGELQPGHYALTAAKAGFSTSQSNVVLSVNQDLEVSFRLAVGNTTEAVEVRESSLAVETTDGTLGTVVDGRQVIDLPLNGRQFTQLILLTPGAVAKQANQQGSFIVPLGAAGISPSVNGQRPQQNNFTIDGASNNAIFTNTWAVSPPPDAIQEFKVQSHISDAQFGNSPGANVNVALKSGTNSFHGALWEFLRNDKLSATNFFTNAVGQQKPAYRQNQYGLTFGGPVVLPRYDGRKKQTYIFGYWEDFKGRQQLTNLLNVPSPTQLGGNFSSLLTNRQATDTGGAPLVDPLGRPILNGQIYDPSSTRQVTQGQTDPVTGLTAQFTGQVRDPFAGNIYPEVTAECRGLGISERFLPGAKFLWQF